VVPGEEQLGALAEWWADRRDERAPEPSSRSSAIGEALRGTR
jgi:hypothetical protein